jgi:uncharacterized protein DUF6596
LTLETPQGTERAARLPSVLEVIYLIFNEGYAAIAGDDRVRPSVAASAKLVLEDGKAFSGRRVLPLGWRDLATDPAFLSCRAAAIDGHRLGRRWSGRDLGSITPQ